MRYIPVYIYTHKYRLYFCKVMVNLKTVRLLTVVICLFANRLEIFKIRFTCENVFIHQSPSFLAWCVILNRVVHCYRFYRRTEVMNT